ncbi:MAG: creatininase family protein [Gemmatimonadetes bacterium]|nr:creatininase family protein [Gemmatimonadota bacterium]
MTGRPYVLSEVTYRITRETAYDLAVLPWGATEAHNLHLPYGTDTIETERIAAEAARIAWDQGARVIVLPTVPFGVQTGQLDVPFCLNVNPSTQLELLRDLADSLARNGLKKLVVLNGHGGNDFRQMIRELLPAIPMFICTVNWYAVVDPSPHFAPGDHAGETETSITMHLAPELVLPLSQAGPGEARSFRLSAFRERWAWAPRRWSEVTRDTGVGNPAQASAEKGQRYLNLVTGKIAEFLVELARADLGDLYA